MELERKRELLIAWNGFITSIIKAREIWNDHLKGIDSKEIELIGSGNGTMLFGALSEATFAVMIEQVIDTYRGFGGLETFLEEVPEEIKFKVGKGEE